jgi:branched-chain amino acid transport system substrate-binding protein
MPLEETPMPRPSWTRRLAVASLLAAVAAVPARAEAPLRIGVIEDLSGMY